MGNNLTVSLIRIFDRRYMEIESISGKVDRDQSRGYQPKHEICVENIGVFGYTNSPNRFEQVYKNKIVFIDGLAVNLTATLIQLILWIERTLPFSWKYSWEWVTECEQINYVWNVWFYEDVRISISPDHWSDTQQTSSSPIQNVRIVCTRVYSLRSLIDPFGYLPWILFSISLLLSWAFGACELRLAADSLMDFMFSRLIRSCVCCVLIVVNVNAINTHFLRSIKCVLALKRKFIRSSWERARNRFKFHGQFCYSIYGLRRQRRMFRSS